MAKSTAPTPPVKEAQKGDSADAATLNEYENKIADADQLLAKKKYQEASDAFVEASILMPDETYPKEKLKEIDNLLNAKILSASETTKEDSDEDGDADGEIVISGGKSKSAKNSEDPLVEVTCLGEDHECTIAGVTYRLRQRRTHKVPRTVAFILANAGVVIKR